MTDCSVGGKTCSSIGDLTIAVEDGAIILKSPDGTRWRITVRDDGALISTQL